MGEGAGVMKGGGRGAVRDMSDSGWAANDKSGKGCDLDDERNLNEKC